MTQIAAGLLFSEKKINANESARETKGTAFEIKKIEGRFPLLIKLR